jgi:2-polyprenyl-3-methyl-5-hydroxy-6-metoxy-1,4-benzoquinol methylase
MKLKIKIKAKYKMFSTNESIAVKETLLQLFEEISEKQRELNLESRALHRIEKFREAKAILNKASGLQIALNTIKEKMESL